MKFLTTKIKSLESYKNNSLFNWKVLRYVKIFFVSKIYKILRDFPSQYYETKFDILLFYKNRSALIIKNIIMFFYISLKNTELGDSGILAIFFLPH